MRKMTPSLAIQSARENAQRIAWARWRCSGLPFSAFGEFLDAELARMEP